MIGPSSSHTARGCAAREDGALYFSFYPKGRFNTIWIFCKTYKGHGTDRALIGGLLGYKEDDANIRLPMN